MSSHLPWDAPLSTVRPASGVSQSMRASLGRTVSNRVTVCPADARWRVRAVRKMVSPSGMSGGFRDVAHLEAEGGLYEACLFEEARQEVIAGRRGVDFADQQSAAAGLPAGGAFRQEAGA